MAVFIKSSIIHNDAYSRLKSFNKLNWHLFPCMRFIKKRSFGTATASYWMSCDIPSNSKLNNFSTFVMHGSNRFPELGQMCSVFSSSIHVRAAWNPNSNRLTAIHWLLRYKWSMSSLGDVDECNSRIMIKKISFQ